MAGKQGKTIYRDADTKRWIGEVRFTEHGKRRRKRFSGKRKSDVAEKVKAFSDALESGETGSRPGKRDPRIKSEMNTYLQFKERTLKASSFESLCRIANNHIVPSIGDLKLSQFGFSDAEALVNEMADADFAESTIRKTVSCMKGFYEFERQRERVDGYNFLAGLTVPVNTIKPKKKIIPLSETECLQFIDYMTENKSVYAPLCLFLIQTGVRIGEALALKEEDFDPVRRTLHIQRNLVTVQRFHNGKKQGKHQPMIQESTKTRAGNRIIPLNNAAYQILLDATPNDQGFLFHGKNGNLFAARNISRFVTNSYLAMGLGERGSAVHLLRHAYGSQLVMAGVPMVEVAALMGHQNINLTYRVYTHLQWSYANEGTTSFNPYPEYLKKDKTS